MTDSLFEEGSGALDRFRSILRKEGYSAQQVEAMSPQELEDEVKQINLDLTLRKYIKEQIPEWIGNGLLTQHQADTWSQDQLKRLFSQSIAIKEYNEGKDKLTDAVTKKTITPLAARVDPGERAITTSELLPLVSDLLVVLAAQQTELQELRKEVESLRDSNIAVFGEQKVLNQFREAASECEMENFEVKMDLVEENNQASSEHCASEESSSQNHKLSMNASAKISGIAKYIAGLDLEHRPL